MRTFRSTFEDQEKQYSIRPVLRINKRAANYARQSDPYAKRKQSESKEMQTVDIQGWCIEQGWIEGLIDTYYADLGLSGTLRPDQRPDMFRLFDNIDQSVYDGGSVICYQESRLFRDDTAIYYNQFIDKCLQHDIIVVVISPYIMVYDFRDEFMKEMFRYKCKEAAEFIPRHIKGWLHPARLRAALRGEWAGLGDIPIGLTIDTDPNSRTFKRFKPYEPHAEILRTRLFERFQMLGGEINLLYRELFLSPVILPPFEPDIEKWHVEKCKVKKYSGGGYILDNRTIIKNILTNPKYIGYRPVRGYIPRDSQGNKIKTHDGIVSEDLFYFAYNRLAKTDLDGNPIENGRKAVRYFHRNNKGKYGLLKFIIEGNGMPVRTRALGKYDGDNPTDSAVYVLEPQGNPSSLAHRRCIEISCEELDAILVDRLFEHVREIAKTQEDLTAYNKKIKEMQSERQKKIAQMKKSLIEIEKEQFRLTMLLGKGEQENKKKKSTGKTKLSKRAEELILKRIDDLEEEREQITCDIDELQERIDGEIGNLEDEVMDLEANWSKYNFEKRRALVQYLTLKVMIEAVSTHWIKIEVLWLHDGWGGEEMYYQRRRGKNADWTEEEISIVQAHYATMPKGQLMSLLPNRGWFGIRQCGSRLGIERVKGRPEEEEKTKQTAWLCPYPGDRASSYSDLEFMRSKGMDKRATRTKWEHVSETIVWSLATFMTALVSGLGLVILSRILLGIAEAPAFPGASKATGYWFPLKERGTATSAFDAAAKFSNVIGAPIVAAAVTIWGWRAGFYVTGILSLLYAALFWIGYHDPKEAKNLKREEYDYIVEGGAQQEVKPVSTAQSLGFLLTRVKIWGLAIGFAAYNYSFYLFLTWLPGYLETQLHMSVLKSGLYTIIPWIVATLTDILIGGVLVDSLIRRGHASTTVRKTLIVIGMLLGITVIGAAFTTNATIAIVWISIALGGLAFSAPIAWSIPALIAPRGTVGAVGSIMNFLGNISGVVAPIVAGYIFDTTGSFLLNFIVAGIILVVGILCYIFMLGKIEQIEAPFDTEATSDTPSAVASS